MVMQTDDHTGSVYGYSNSDRPIPSAQTREDSRLCKGSRLTELRCAIHPFNTSLAPILRWHSDPLCQRLLRVMALSDDGARLAIVQCNGQGETRTRMTEAATF